MRLDFVSLSRKFLRLCLRFFRKEILKSAVAAGLSGVLLAETAFAYKPQTTVWEERAPRHNVELASADLALPAATSLKSVLATLPEALPKSEMGSPSLPLPADFLANVNIRRTSGSDTASAVILLEDVHHNLEAQRHLSLALQALGAQAGGAPLPVSLEGAVGGFRFSSFHRFPAPVATAVADAFLESGDIGGPSHAGFVTRPVSGHRGLNFMGADDAENYRKNVEAYRRSGAVRAQTRAAVADYRRSLFRREATEFSRPLAAFDAVVEGHHRGEVPLAQYAAVLASHAEPTESVRRFLETQALESRLDLARIDVERRRVLEKLVTKLSAAEISGLVSLSLGYRNGTVSFGGYYKGLRSLCARNGIDLAATPAFDAYIRYVLLADGIDATALFSDLESMERAAYDRLATTAGERRLTADLRRSRLVEHLVEFGLTAQEWETYRNDRLHDRSIDLSAFENFYEAAEKRNDAMVASLPARGSSVLVAGGFHSQAVADRLHRSGRTVIVCSPKLTKVDLASGSAYLSIFDRERTPLERIFAGEKLFLASMPAGASRRLIDGPDATSELAHVAEALTLDQALAPAPVVRRAAQELGDSAAPVSVDRNGSETTVLSRTTEAELATVVQPASAAAPRKPFWTRVSQRRVDRRSVTIYSRSNRRWSSPQGLAAAGRASMAVAKRSLNNRLALAGIPIALGLITIGAMIIQYANFGFGWHFLIQGAFAAVSFGFSIPFAVQLNSLRRAYQQEEFVYDLIPEARGLKSSETLNAAASVINGEIVLDRMLFDVTHRKSRLTPKDQRSVIAEERRHQRYQRAHGFAPDARRGWISLAWEELVVNLWMPLREGFRFPSEPEDVRPWIGFVGDRWEFYLGRAIDRLADNESISLDDVVTAIRQQTEERRKQIVYRLLEIDYRFSRSETTRIAAFRVLDALGFFSDKINATELRPTGVPPVAVGASASIAAEIAAHVPAALKAKDLVGSGRKDDIDIFAKNVALAVFFLANLMGIATASEGIGRDEVEAISAAEVVNAAATGGRVYYSIDVVENTNVTASADLSRRPVNELRPEQGGGSTPIVTGLGVQDLGNVPDVYADVIAFNVPPEKTHLFANVDPLVDDTAGEKQLIELTGRNPAGVADLHQKLNVDETYKQLKDLYTRIADANGIGLGDLEVVVIRRDLSTRKKDGSREQTRIAALERLAAETGLTLTMISDGTLDNAIRAGIGRKSGTGKHLIFHSTSGSPEAWQKLQRLAAFSTLGAVAATRLYSKRVNYASLTPTNPKDRDAVNLGNRYNWSEDEKEEIRKLRRENGDAEEIINGTKIFRLADVHGGVDAATGLITSSGGLRVEGATEIEPGKFLVHVFRSSQDDHGRPYWWIDAFVIREPIVEPHRHYGGIGAGQATRDLVSRIALALPFSLALTVFLGVTFALNIHLPTLALVGVVVAANAVPVVMGFQVVALLRAFRRDRFGRAGYLIPASMRFSDETLPLGTVAAVQNGRVVVNHAVLAQMSARSQFSILQEEIDHLNYQIRHGLVGARRTWYGLYWEEIAVNVGLPIRRFLARATALVVIIALLPLYVVMGTVVYFDVGWPVLHSQTRVGFLGQPLPTVKFRTLPQGADETAQTPSRLGSWIRHSMLDELPQLWQVVRGKMVWFGPRPAFAREIDDEYIETILNRTPPGIFSTSAKDRHSAPKFKPGGPRSVEHRVMDRDDVDHWSVVRNTKLFFSFLATFARAAATLPFGAGAARYAQAAKEKPQEPVEEPGNPRGPPTARSLDNRVALALPFVAVIAATLIFGGNPLADWHGVWKVAIIALALWPIAIVGWQYVAIARALSRAARGAQAGPLHWAVARFGNYYSGDNDVAAVYGGEIHVKHDVMAQLSMAQQRSVLAEEMRHLRYQRYWGISPTANRSGFSIFLEEFVVNFIMRVIDSVRPDPEINRLWGEFQINEEIASIRRRNDGFNRILNELSPSTEKLQEMVADFMGQLQSGIDGARRSLEMLRTKIKMPTGHETGYVVVVDWGGSKGKFFLWELQGGGRVRLVADLDNYVFTDADRANPRGLYPMFVGKIQELMSTLGDEDRRRDFSVVVAFAWPPGSAWSKGWRDPNGLPAMTSEEIRKGFQAVIDERGLTNLKAEEGENDTLGPMMIENYERLGQNPSAILATISMILGTGHNIAALINGTIWNLESGAYDSPALRSIWTSMDQATDRNSEKPGVHLFEKMIAGGNDITGGIGEVLRNSLLRLRTEQGLFAWNQDLFSRPNRMDSGFVSRVAATNGDPTALAKLLAKEGVTNASWEERLMLYALAEQIMDRSAWLTGMAIASVIRTQDPGLTQPHVIPIEGSVFEDGSRYPARLQRALAELLGDEAAARVELIPNRGRGGAGTAVLTRLGTSPGSATIDMGPTTGDRSDELQARPSDLPQFNRVENLSDGTRVIYLQGAEGTRDLGPAAVHQTVDAVQFDRALARFGFANLQLDSASTPLTHPAQSQFWSFHDLGGEVNGEASLSLEKGVWTVTVRTSVDQLTTDLIGHLVATLAANGMTAEETGEGQARSVRNRLFLAATFVLPLVIFAAAFALTGTHPLESNWLLALWVPLIAWSLFSAVFLWQAFWLLAATMKWTSPRGIGNSAEYPPHLRMGWGVAALTLYGKIYANHSIVERLPRGQQRSLLNEEIRHQRLWANRTTRPQSLLRRLFEEWYVNVVMPTVDWVEGRENVATVVNTSRRIDQHESLEVDPRGSSVGQNGRVRFYRTGPRGIRLFTDFIGGLGLLMVSQGLPLGALLLIGSVVGWSTLGITRSPVKSITAAVGAMAFFVSPLGTVVAAAAIAAAFALVRFAAPRIVARQWVAEGRRYQAATGHATTSSALVNALDAAAPKGLLFDGPANDIRNAMLARFGAETNGVDSDAGRLFGWSTLAGYRRSIARNGGASVQSSLDRSKIGKAGTRVIVYHVNQLGNDGIVPSELKELQALVERAGRESAAGERVAVVAAVSPGLSADNAAALSSIIGAGRGAAVAVDVTEDLRLDDGTAYSYEKLLAKAAAGARLDALDALVKGSYDDAAFLTFSKIPAQFMADGRLRAVWTVLANIGAGWAPLPVETLIRAAEVAKESA